MLVGRGRLEKMVASDVVAHEECVGPGKITADQAIALSAPEPHQRLETGAEIASGGCSVAS